MQPAAATALIVPYPLVTIPSQTQKMPSYCVTCTPLGKQCPTNYPMPLNPNWSDLEGEQEDWNGDKQKEKELELQNNNITDSPSPQYQSTSTTDTDKTVAPQLTNTLVPSKT